jgi:hypothetical protein
MRDKGGGAARLWISAPDPPMSTTGRDLATTYRAAGHDHWNQRSGSPLGSVHQRDPAYMSSPRDCLRRACIIDGEAVACDDNGVASFDLVPSPPR